MLTIEPTGAVLGATVRGVDLSRELDAATFGRILRGLGEHGVLRFPDQHLDMRELRRFSERFGEIQGPVAGHARRGAGQLRRGRHPVEPQGERRNISAWPTPARTGTPTCRIAR